MLHSAIAASFINNGIPRAALTELSGRHGSGKTEFVLRLLSENSSGRVAWIEDHFTVYPNAFAQFNVALDRILFVEAEEFALWATHQVLRSHLFEFVVLTVQKRIEEIDLRRLQLSSEKAGASLVLLSENATTQSTWPIALQAQIHQRQIRILKNRRRMQWIATNK